MFKKYIILFSICLLSVIKAEYSVVNAFPNLSFQDPVGIHHAGDGTNRIFIVEQEGRIKVFNNEEIRQAIIDEIPLRRVGKVEEIASVICFLASDTAAYITGQVLQIDGGLAI